MSVNSESDFKAKLIAAVKKEVKQVMEESVTRKFVHEESGSVTALCGAVEACLSQGLRRRALGLFKTSSTTALLHKIAKHSPEAAAISKRVQEIENVDPNRKSSSSSDSLTKPVLKKNASFHGLTPLPKYLWIRLALFEKQLAKIIDYLVTTANRYYEKDSLVADPDYGNILSSLLVGPCALDYSKTKTPDHFWTDPPADELVQRHRISSAQSTPPSVRRPIINFRRSLNTSSEDSMTTRNSTQHYAKDYVESLHQNSRATLLFGKNNVLVLPANSDVTEAMPGYLSLHQSANGLTIKWTPNQLMNGFTDEVVDKSVYWDYALQVRLDEVVYVHCHQESGSESGGTIILVGQDGVQRPPIHFPKGGHMLAFLSCIETGLLPRGRLDPPLWSQRSNTNKKRRPLATLGENEEDNTKDLVFRIIDSGHHKEIALKRNQLMDTRVQIPSKTRVQLNSSSTSSESSTKSLSLDQNIPDSPPSVCIKAVCDSMKRQIISRAFYGWLAYCRHLSTVRRHLSGLVNPKIINGDAASNGLTFEKWMELSVGGVVLDKAEVYRLTYFGGVNHDLRKEVWPYLLGHYKFGSTTEERQQLGEETKQAYENTMSEWLAVEAIVRQRDKETQASAIAKLSSGSISGEAIPKGIQRDLSNEVFEDVSDYDYESDENEQHRKKGAKTKQNTIQYDSDLEDEENGTTIDNDVHDINEDVDEKQLPEVNCTKETDFAEETSRENGKENNQNDVDNEETSLTEEELGKHDLKYQTTSKQYKPTRKSSRSVGLWKEDSTSSTKAQFSSIDTEYSSKETESSEVCTEIHGDEFNPENSTNDSLDFTPTYQMEDYVHNVIVTNASVDIPSNVADSVLNKNNLDSVKEENSLDTLDCMESHGLASPAVSACVSPASSNGGVYTQELLETFGLNLHRIEKDVQRCDRNYWYFTTENLEKLRNVMCTYVWEHLDIGYMQGMCDLVAPLLVIFNDESLTYACFCHLMERMVENFPNGNAMDCHFANMRSLIQILDSEIYELMQAHGDYTHFYFCYRWFLLDFKRELVYPDVNATWEAIWAAQEVSSTHFVLFLALALLETYRDIILSNSMDFTDIIKFFNEMAERHNASAVLGLARDLVLQLQQLIENK